MSEPMFDSSRPSPDELDELAALYAAGALSADEKARFEQWLASAADEDRERVDTYMPVVEQLCRLVEPCQPRDAVKKRLLARIEKHNLAAPGDATVAPKSRPLDRSLPETVQGATKPRFEIQRGGDAQWFSPAPGQSIRVLAIDRPQRRFTALVRLEAGARYPAHHHSGAEECYVLEGDLRAGDEVLYAGDFQRALPDSWHEEQWSLQGCVCLIVAPLQQLLELRR
jgi:anti-sigma factor ChrR (cupin superfamily)